MLKREDTGSDVQSTSTSLLQLAQSGQRLIDNASCTFFRVAFGAVMANWAWDYLTLGRVTEFYVKPAYHFTYFGLDWIRPWPGDGMYFHFWALLILAVCIAAGFLFRLSSLLFALGFTYVLLLDRTNYQNHYYLIALISWWLPLLPLNQNVSVDAWICSGLRSPTIPAWALWILRFHIALPYFFGGIAKLQSDWLLGAPLGQMLASKQSWPVVGEWLAGENLAIALAWSGMLFDLLIVPALLYRRTRIPAYCCCIVFHLMNSAIFNIHVFPWFMLVATTLYFAADWPRRLLGGKPLDALKNVRTASVAVPWLKAAWSLALLYVAFHCLWPLRHHLYTGDACWNERGHHFAWRMMLRGKTVVLGYAVKDKVTGRVVDGNINRFLSKEQSDKFGRDPEMILQFAHFIGDQYRAEFGHDCHVHALVLTSLNGRKPELMIDPNVDLLEVPRGFYARSWVLPQREPLRHPAWDQPLETWRQHVELPKLEFLANASQPTGHS